MPSPTATRCCCISCRSPASPKSTSCSAAQPKFTRDNFIPIARFIADPMVLVVNDQTPYKTLKELVDDAKKNPDKIVFSFVGSLRRAASADRALHEGRRHQDASSADQWRRAGADRDPRQQFAGAVLVDRGLVRADEGRQVARARHASATSARPSLPDVPTLKELGYDVEFYLWVGLFAPKGTPEPMIKTICARPHEGRRRYRAVQDRDGQSRQTR